MNPLWHSFGAARHRDLDRLLRAAAPVSESAPEMRYGFDTRVVTLWRMPGNGEPNGIARLIRSVAVVAAMILIASTAGAYQELIRSKLSSEPLSNEFAIADSAIADEVSP
jgi:hypothetical protein